MVLRNYFDEDYLAFIHIMIPYIEAKLRNLIKLTGDSIYKLNKSGTGYNAIDFTWRYISKRIS